MTAPTQTDAPAAPQNLFGICARVGEDFGFNPLWLRLAFAGLLILNPVAVIGAYFALGVVVLTSRLLFPNRKPATPAPVALVAEGQPKPVVAKSDDLPMAA